MQELLHLASFGFGLQDLALAVIRVGIGVFFAISGFNKLFNRDRHQSLENNLRNNGIPWPVPMAWWVAYWEFVSGAMLALGVLSVFNAVVLAIVCIVACKCESRRKVLAFRPINCADTLACYLYLPEVLYLLILLVTIVAGPGAYSVDSLV